jgi:hypothetical protein
VRLGSAGWRFSGSREHGQREVPVRDGFDRRRGSVLTGTIDGKDEQAFRSELFHYRYETVAMLQKYLAVSLDLGRLPSVLGGEMFRSKVTSYRISTFEDLVIFVTDFSACMDRLSGCAQKFVALHVFQEYSKEEAALKMGCDVRNARRIYCDALDEMSEILLRFRMIDATDWIGHRVAQEGWFEGCPILRRNMWSSARGLPPKKGSMAVGVNEKAKLIRMPMKTG